MKTPLSRFIVNGNSMTPTLREGQDILSFNWAYLGKKPKIGDIVIVKRGKGEGEIIKRVQRIEGDKVYLIGDNMEESTDSRHFGLIDRKQIIGRVVYGPNDT